MSFLSSVVGYVVTAILSALGGWLLKVLHNWQRDKAANDQSAADAAAAQKALEDAKTKEELDNAAKNIADNFGK